MSDKDIASAQAIERADLFLGLLDMAIDEFKSSETEMDFHYHWSAFLRNYKKLAATLIAFGMKSDSFRGVAHKYKNEQRTDPILLYLLVSRNSDEHSEEKENESIATYGAPCLIVGGALRIGRGGIASIKDSLIGGKIVNLTIDWRGDVPKFTFTGPNTGAPIIFEDKSFTLNAVTDIHNKRIEVPSLPSGELLKPEELSAHARRWLERLRKDVRLEQA